MWCYRRAKAAELSLSLRWLRNELDELDRTDSVHAVTLGHLRQQFEQVENSFGLVTAVLSLNDETFAVAVDGLLQSIHRYIVTTSTHYIAGLQRQTPLDLTMRKILLNARSRLRLDWIEDFVVRLDRPLALLPRYRGLYSIPLFFGPPNLLETVLELPGVYHELGHNAFARDEEYRKELEAVVKNHFETAKNLAGPMPAAQKAVRDKQLDDAARSWSEARLAEIFCDLFAGYVSGSANYGSIVEMGMMGATNPFIMSSPRHPPESARVQLAYFALSDEQKQNGTVQNIREVWKTFSGKFTSDLRFRHSCSDDLLSALASRTISLLQQRLPNLPRYQPALPTLEAAKTISKGATLEELINAGIVILFEAPDDFFNWQQQTKSLIE
jgi:hypothetical protein